MSPGLNSRGLHPSMTGFSELWTGPAARSCKKLAYPNPAAPRTRSPWTRGSPRTLFVATTGLALGRPVSEMNNAVGGANPPGRLRSFCPLALTEHLDARSTSNDQNCGNRLSTGLRPSQTSPGARRRLLEGAGAPWRRK